MSDERFEKFNEARRHRSPKAEDQLKSKKIQFSMTEKRYEEMKRLQKLLGKNTLTSTLEHFIDLGIERAYEELEHVRGH